MLIGVLVASWSHPVAAVQIWGPSPAAIPLSVPPYCRAALVQNITCPNQLITAPDAAGGMSLSGADAIEYCTAGCYSSLKAFQARVAKDCGALQYTLYANSTVTQSPSALADSLVWAYNVSCIQDSYVRVRFVCISESFALLTMGDIRSSGFCLSSLYAGKKTACSDCALKYGAAMLGSDYGRTRISPGSFSSLLSSCKADPTKYTYSYTSVPTSATTLT